MIDQGLNLLRSKQEIGRIQVGTGWSVHSHSLGRGNCAIVSKA